MADQRRQRRVAETDPDRAGHEHHHEQRNRIDERASAPPDRREQQPDRERVTFAQPLHDRTHHPALDDDAECGLIGRARIEAVSDSQSEGWRDSRPQIGLETAKLGKMIYAGYRH